MGRLISAALLCFPLFGQATEATVPSYLEPPLHSSSEVTSRLKDADKSVLCAMFGDIARGHYVHEDFHTESLPALVSAELKRRRLKPDRQKAISQRLRIGDSDCTMFAVLWRPTTVNRTVNGSGEHIQYVFQSGVYVYVTNGVVTAWQD